MSEDIVNYKRTSIGLIPKDWNVKKLEEIIAEAKLGGNYENSESNHGIPIIKMGNIGRGGINIAKIQNLPPDEVYNESDILKEGDLLFNTRNTLDLVGKVAIWKNELPFALYNSNLLRLKFKSEFVASNWFMNYLFNSFRSLSQLKGFATGTTSVAAIYSRDLNYLKIPLPPLPEQEKIAKVLSTWDEAIDKYKAIIENLRQRKKGLTQEVLLGKIRFSETQNNPLVKNRGFVIPKDWKVAPISKLVKQVKKSVTPEPDTLYSQIGIRSHAKGIFYKEAVTGLSLGNKSVFEIEPNCFIVNIVFAWEHAIAKTTINEVGMIASHRFPMYKPLENELDLDYMLHFFKSKKGKELLGIASPGGAGRNKTLGQSEFLKLSIPVPPLAEQKRIAEFLDKIDTEIIVHQQKLAHLQNQKKGLMQQLLTGKVRVKVNH